MPDNEQVPAIPAEKVELPQDSVREKTREQFEKLVDSNRKLFEANEALRRELEKSQQKAAPVATQDENRADFVGVNADTGEEYIIQEKLSKRLNTAEETARQAKEQLDSYIKQSEQKEVDRQNREAITAYPELDPKNKEKYNKEFNLDVRARLIDSMYNPEDYGGRPLTFKEAADMVKGRTTKAEQVAAVTEEEQAKKEGKELKQAVSAEVLTQPAQIRQQEQISEELESLRRRTRMGDDLALAQRLANTPHTRKDDVKET